jgi:hypothetical protein
MMTVAVVWFVTVLVGAYLQTQVFAPRQPY